MPLLAVIPARLGATRLPRKPMRLLGGRPLVVRVWERAIALGVADRVVVATDAAEVADAVRQAGGEVVLTRDDHPSGTDRVAEVLAGEAYRDVDAIVNIQGDEPFASAEVVRAAARCVTELGFPLGTVAVPARSEELATPDVVKVVAADDGRAMYFSRAPIPFLRDPADVDERALRDARVLRHVGIYAYRREALMRWVALPPHPLERIERLEQLRPLAYGLPMGVAVVEQAPPAGIDTEEDLARADAAWPAWAAAQAAHAARSHAHRVSASDDTPGRSGAPSAPRA